MRVIGGGRLEGQLGGRRALGWLVGRAGAELFELRGEVGDRVVRVAQFGEGVGGAAEVAAFDSGAELGGVRVRLVDALGQLALAVVGRGRGGGEVVGSGSWTCLREGRSGPRPRRTALGP